ncbi:hypothetical protein ACFVTM_08905 [Arthrobacter sp. NPDC058130]|uniref:hypothetical protein n=1 Tax=Arthrobacter sp. NPDC058130 TaxID=3346353 RepID=UPI0036E92DD6
MLALVLLLNALAGQGEGVLVITGLVALFTALYSLVFKRRSWLGLPHQGIATAVLVAGLACAMLGIIASIASVGRSSTTQAAPAPAPAPTVTVTATPTTNAQADADTAAKLKAREDAVAAREAAVTAKETPANVIGQGTWTVGKDMPPGTYRTTKAVIGDCSWKITRTGSNGKDYIAYDYFVKGGFPQVQLVEGQTFDTDGCGDWAKQ